MFGQWLVPLLEAWIERFRREHGIVTQDARHSRWDRAEGQHCLLHVGCGHAAKKNLIGAFAGDDWREVRLDADPEVAPDIVASMTDLGMIPDAAVDAVFSSHGIEHLYWHEVPAAFAEFRRVLRDDGCLVVTCPDLQAAAEWIAADRVFETAYISAAGEITPFDLVYSFRPFVAENPRWMAHHCGFTLSTLSQLLREAGFAALHGFRRKDAFDLWVLASAGHRPESELADLARRLMPYPS